MNPYMEFMNPFPHQGNQMQNQQSYPHPSYEAIPPQFRGCPEGYHPFYHPPCASSGMNGFAYPSQYYGCCNHNFFPLYFPPPTPSMPYGHHHHPTTHCCGGYSGAHPCHFPPFLPTMGPTQFEYQKDHNPKYQHSFDCPNNMCRGGNYLKIEEPQTEPKGDTSVVPSDFKNSPYPILLVPPNYIKDNSSRKANEPTCDRQEGSLNSDEKLKPAEHQPRFLNGWLPVDIDKWKSVEQVEDDSGRKMIHKDNEKPYFPLPFFYVPYKANDMGTMEQKNVGQQCPQGVSVEQMDDRPLSPIHGDSSKNKSNDGIIICEDPRMMDTKKVGDFPSEKKGEGKTAQTTEVTSGTSSKHVDNEARKTSGDGKRKMSSPTKSSKLPPVCLRVDPLPKKKKGCSPSKPSSPRDDKDKSGGDSFKEDTKSKAKASPDGAKISPGDILARNKPEEQTTSIEQPKRKVKTIKVYDALSQPGEDVLVSNINCRNTNEDRSAHTFTVTDQPNHTQSEKNEDKDASKETLAAGKLNDDSIRCELSEDEAAKIIQSAYRGYEERKWEPLKKLKNIKAIQDEFTRLKKQIEALECTQDNTLLDKSRTVIGETIMNLLLRLDSIQGLPPNVRQVRKSLARDLMSLQEQLDALGQKQAEKSIPSASLVKSAEAVQTADCACIQDGQEKNHLVLESGNEIEEKDKNKNHEESPLIELSMDEEKEEHEEDVPDVVDRHTIQLNDILQIGSETLKDESPQDVSSNTGNLESESMSQRVHDAQGSSVNQPGKEDYEAVRLVEDKLNRVPNMGPAELQEQVPLEPEENENGDDNGLPEQTPSNSISKMTDIIEVDDENRPETVDEAPADDTCDLNKASLNAEPVSVDHVTEPVQVCEDVQDLSLKNNEKADDPVPESVAESTTTQVRKECKGVHDDVMENSEKGQDQNESIELDDTPCVQCEEPAVVVDEDYDAPADLTTFPHEQKQAEGSLEMFGHPAIESEEVNPEKEKDEGKLMPVSSSQSGFTDTDRSLIEENERLKEKLQKFIEAGQEQLSAITSLSRKVRDLERKLHRKKKVKMCRSRAAGSRSSCLKMSMDDELPFALAN